MTLTDLVQYAADVMHASTHFEIGLFSRDVVQGYFTQNEFGRVQEKLYNSLLKNGFYRTPWQVVFPGQTAGIVRKIEPPIEGMDEIHVRFYEDGVVAAELEHGRFSFGHWRKKRTDGCPMLHSIVEEEIQTLSPSEKEQININIKPREYSAVHPFQIRLPSIPISGTSISRAFCNAFICLQYPLTMAATLYLLSRGELYYALEPGILALAETPIIAGMIMSRQKKQTQ